MLMMSDEDMEGVMPMEGIQGDGNPGQPGMGVGPGGKGDMEVGEIGGDEDFDNFNEDEFDFDDGFDDDNNDFDDDFDDDDFLDEL